VRGTHQLQLFEYIRFSKSSQGYQINEALSRVEKGLGSEEKTPVLSHPFLSGFAYFHQLC